MEATIYRDMSLKPEALNLNPKRTKNKPSITPNTRGLNGKPLRRSVLAMSQTISALAPGTDVLASVDIGLI